MDPLYQLCRVKDRGGDVYRLRGPDGGERLRSTFKHALYLPAVELRTPDGTVAARIKRGKLLNFDIVASQGDDSLLFRIAVPRIQTMFRKSPFAMTGPKDEPLCTLMPRSAWKQARGEDSSVWDTINDDELVLLRGQEVLGHTSYKGEDPPPPPTAAQVATNLAKLPFEIGKYVYDEVTGANDGKQIPSGALRLVRGDLECADVFIMTVLLFRRFDYQSMRQVD
ncbi:MAG TPA: hypothetical protein P5337_10970 [Aestuariivirga sp.]|nr:hypothetical protein [Aestuariivirga sp.]